MRSLQTTEGRWHCSRRRDLQQRGELRSKRSRCLTIRTYLSLDLNDLRAIQKDVWLTWAEKVDFIDIACKKKKKKLRSGFRAGAGTCNPRYLRYIPKVTLATLPGSRTVGLALESARTAPRPRLSWLSLIAWHLLEIYILDSFEKVVFSVGSKIFTTRVQLPLTQ